MMFSDLSFWHATRTIFRQINKWKGIGRLNSSAHIIRSPSAKMAETTLLNGWRTILTLGFIGALVYLHSAPFCADIHRKWQTVTFCRRMFRIYLGANHIAYVEVNFFQDWNAWTQTLTSAWLPRISGMCTITTSTQEKHWKTKPKSI